MEPWTYQPARDLELSGVRRWRSHRREAGLGEFLVQSAWWGAARTYLKLAHRMRVEGRENLPTQPPFVLIANHSSHLDAIALAAALSMRARQCVLPVAAGDTFFDRPVMAAFAANCLNALPLWRKSVTRHAIDELRHRLTREPCGYILFPEGTRSRDGRMGAFKAGIGMLLAGTGVPVNPCHIDGAFVAWPADAARPTWGAPIRIRIGESMRFDAVEQSRAGWDRIAEGLERAVRKLCDPV